MVCQRVRIPWERGKEERKICGVPGNVRGASFPLQLYDEPMFENVLVNSFAAASPSGFGPHFL